MTNHFPPQKNRRALSALFGEAVGKDTVSRVWRKVKSDWDAWNARSLADEPGVREDGQKVLLAIKQMGGESTEAWRSVLDDLVKRGLRRPELLIVDGGAELACRCRGAPCISTVATVPVSLDESQTAGVRQRPRLTANAYGRRCTSG
jgi:hypothetical protein